MEFIHDRGEFNKYLYYHCHCTNAGQSPEERRLKYALARYFGKCWQDASKLRDYRTTTFAKTFGYSSWKSLLKSIEE